MNSPAPDTGRANAPLAKAAPRPQLASTRTGSFVMRVLLGLCGLGLVIGFFMPWLSLGSMVAVTGFSLIVTSGEMVNMISGSHRLLLFAVPVFGALLVVGAALGHRLVLWAALAAGLTVLGFGAFTLIRLFLESTGIGMWIVVGSALLALGVALIGIGHSE